MCVCACAHAHARYGRARLDYPFSMTPQYSSPAEKQMMVILGEVLRTGYRTFASGSILEQHHSLSQIPRYWSNNTHSGCLFILFSKYGQWHCQAQIEQKSSMILLILTLPVSWFWALLWLSCMGCIRYQSSGYGHTDYRHDSSGQALKLFIATCNIIACSSTSFMWSPALPNCNKVFEEVSWLEREGVLLPLKSHFMSRG